MPTSKRNEGSVDILFAKMFLLKMSFSKTNPFAEKVNSLIAFVKEREGYAPPNILKSLHDYVYAAHNYEHLSSEDKSELDDRIASGDVGKMSALPIVEHPELFAHYVAVSTQHQDPFRQHSFVAGHIPWERYGNSNLPTEEHFPLPNHDGEDMSKILRQTPQQHDEDWKNGVRRNLKLPDKHLNSWWYNNTPEGKQLQEVWNGANRVQSDGMHINTYHTRYANDFLHPYMRNSARGLADDIHRRIRQEVETETNGGWRKGARPGTDADDYPSRAQYPLSEEGEGMESHPPNLGGSIRRIQDVAMNPYDDPEYDYKAATRGSGSNYERFKQVPKPPKNPFEQQFPDLFGKALQKFLAKQKEEEWERFGDPDYKADDKFNREERRGEKPFSRKQIKEFAQQKKEQEQADIAQGFKGMPNLYVNYPGPPKPPKGLSSREYLEYLAQPEGILSGQRPEVPGEESKIPPIPIDTKRTFDRNLGLRAFGPKATKDDYPKTLAEWKLTNINNAVSKFIKLLKEGDGGSGVDGLNGVVFTSENAGIFTPTHGGNRTTAKSRKHIKYKHDKQRRKLLGKNKKNGVERLEQFVQKAAQDMPLTRMKNMTGQLGSGSAHNPVENRKQPADGSMQVDYKQLGMQRAIGKDNEPNESMSGTPGMMDASTQAAIPQSEDPSVTKQNIPGKPQWGKSNVVVQKYGVGGISSIGVQPDQNPDANPPKYIERGDTPDDQKNKQQDVKMNDVTKRVKKYQDDEDADVEQPLGTASAASHAIQNQMSAYGSGDEQGEYKRGADKDKIESELDEYLDESESAKMVDAIKRLQAKKQAHIDKGDKDALFLAMMNDIESHE